MPADVLTIASWNMAANTPRAPQADVAALLGLPGGEAELEVSLGADILLLQEASPDQWGFEPAGLVDPDRSQRWRSVIVAPGVAAISPLEVSVRLEDGHVAAGTARMQGGREIVIVSLHSATRPGSVMHLRAIFEWLWPLIDGRTCIVGGDFNSSRRNAAERWPEWGHAGFFADLDTRLVDCANELHDEELPTYWLPQHKLKMQNDHIFISPDLRGALASCQVRREDAFMAVSDHAPIEIRLRQ